jgi:hypothetical protein
MTQKEFVVWLCSKTVRINAAEAAEVFKQLLNADAETKLALVRAMTKPAK